MMTHTAPKTHTGSTGPSAVLYFAGVLFLTSVRSWQGYLTSLLTPLFMLVVFWLTGSQSNPEFIRFIFPAIVAFTVMFAGVPITQRIAEWRARGIFERLAVTPVPLGRLMLAVAGAQTVTALLQAILILLFGTLVLGIGADPGGALLSIVVLTLGAICFITFGALIAAFVERVETATTLYIFVLLPMTFLGNTFFPAEQMPALVQRLAPWLPTAMLSDMARPLLADGMLPDRWWVPLLGLVGYILLFGLGALVGYRRYARR